MEILEKQIQRKEVLKNAPLRREGPRKEVHVPGQVLGTKPKPEKFAFIIHFRNEIKADMKLYWKPLGLVPENMYRALFYAVPLPSSRWSVIKDTFSEKEFGCNEILPLNAGMFFKMGHKKITQRVNKVLDKLVAQGYTIAGLGALTAPLTLGGKSLESRTDIGITNGNAFTAVILNQGVRKLVGINPSLSHAHAIVGATGSVGSCLARLVAREGTARRLLLVARNLEKLQRLQRELLEINPAIDIEVSVEMADIKSCKLITLLTASADNLIESAYLGQDAVILDGTQPRNTSPKLLEERPDVTIIDGGIAYVPGIEMAKGGFGLPEHHYFACFSETALLAVAGHQGHFCLGNPSLEQASYIENLASQYKLYGFGLSEFISFGVPLKNSIYAS